MRSVLILIGILLTSSVWAQQNLPAKSMNEALLEVASGAEYQATESDIRAIELLFQSRDLILQPTLEIIGRRLHEQRELLFRSSSFKPRTDSLDVTLMKPFSTGTTLMVGPTWENAITPSQASGETTTVDWQIGMSQSLWRDGFGRSTSLRHAREEYERQRDLAEALAKRGQMLLDFETIYWDWALVTRSLELEAKNVKRGQEILRWVRDRFNRQAAESTDLLQAQALLTQRELRVATLRQNLTQVGILIERFVPNRQWQPNPDDLAVARPVDALVARWKGEGLAQTAQLEYIRASNEASASAERAKEERESIRPELNLELAYGKNAVESNDDNARAIRRSYEENHEYSSVGVVFRTGLDMGLERKRVDAARARQKASEQRRDARLAENKIAWDQLQRELADLKTQTERAHDLVGLQTRKANAERERYRKGRSTAFQAITFEQEASEAELTLWQLHAMTRKTEARARLFAR